MTLMQVIRELESAIRQQPAVRTICREDIYKLNGDADIYYGVCAWVQGNHSYIGSGLREYEFTLFYVDRLTIDKGNEQEIESVGMDVIDNVVRTLPDTWEIAPYQYTPFPYRFKDECAGVYTRLKFVVPTEWQCKSAYADKSVKIM